jgi:phage baseplate assembly protein W
VSTYSFKSSGKTAEQRIVEKIEATRIPIGIKTPLEINQGEGADILVTYETLEETVQDNLRNLLLTNWGERLGLYDFGANLRPLMSELVSLEDFDSSAIERISSAVSRWMPYVSLDNYTSSTVRENNRNLARINIQITYNVPTLGVTNKLLEINLNAM